MNALLIAVYIGGTFLIPPTRHGASVSLHQNDDVLATFGNTAAAPDCWFEWDTADTDDFELKCTDVDAGGGTDGIIFSVDTGTDDVVFVGDVTGVNLTFTGVGLVGSDANFTDFPNANFISSLDDTGITTDNARSGLVNECAADGTNYCAAVRGIGKTSTASVGGGGRFRGIVNHTDDTTVAVGAWALADMTHAGGENRAFHCSATGGASNTCIFHNSGDYTYNAASVTNLKDNQASALSYDTADKTGMLVFVTTNNSEKITSTVNIEPLGFLITQEDLGATCTLGEWHFDTGGTAEICYCQATDTWACVTVDNADGPTD
jgi:hypothetical protein